MSYDSPSFLSYYRRPRDHHGGSRSITKVSTSSSIFSSSPRPPPPGRRTQRPDGSWERTDPARAGSLNTELLGLRAQEREQLVDLNDRFVAYIEKVRRLELQNRALLVELEALRRRRTDASRLQALYGDRARRLRATVDSESGEKKRMEAQRDYLIQVHEQTKERHEEELERRADAEAALRRAREDAGRAALSTCDAEATVVSLCDELVFLRKVFAEEQVELRAQLQVATVSVEEPEASRPDLCAALRDVRTQYERLARRNAQAAEDWCTSGMVSAEDAAGQNDAAVRAIREETAEYRRLLQTRCSDVEALRNVIESLDKQVDDLEETQAREVAKYQTRIDELEQDIADAKQEMERYLREYHDLLAVKMALDMEVAAYRKLLEGEEVRLAHRSLPGP